MGRRRQNRKQNTERVNSEMSLIDGDISSGSESENSVVHSKTATAVSVPAVQSSSALVHNQQIPDETVSSRQEYCTASNFSSNEGRPELNMQTRSMYGQNLQVSDKQPLQTETMISGSGDEPKSQLSGEITHMSTMLQTLLHRVNQQSETHNRAMSECMTGVTNLVRENTSSVSECMVGATSMLRDTCESMKECMMGVASLIKESSVQSGQLLNAVQNLNDRVVRDGSTSTTNNEHQLYQSTSVTQSVSQQSSHVIDTRPVTTSNKSYDHFAVTSLPLGLASVTNSPSMITQSRMPTTSTFDTTYLAQSNVVASSPLSTGQINVQRPSLFNSQPLLTQSLPVVPTTTSMSDTNLSKHRFVKLPAFSGNSSDSWKVWHARFTTVANLNN